MRTAIGLALLVTMVTVLASFAWAQESEGRRRVDRRLGFESPQVALTTSGAVVMLWARPHGKGHDLFVSIRDAAGHFGEATRVNDRPGSVHALPIDEARPALATGANDRVAVGWVDDRGDIFAALGHENGRRFEAPVRVNARKGNPERNFISVALDDRGTVHVVWLDARNAKEGQEEPAHVYYARIPDGRYAEPERNLTADFTASVCGCCRPSVIADRYSLAVLYRNVSEDGYRDIHRLSGELGGRFGEPERLGPATWKIDGCPMAGPVTDGERVLWRDGSTGKARIVEAFSATAPLQPLVRERDDWAPTGSPRLVDGASSAERVLLVPGRPYPRLLRRSAGQWSTWVDELPTWCLSAVILEGQLLMVGDQHGELQLEALDLP
jgi:hypothetical protein